ncbi:MAG TPA: cytochrome C oxidase subunit IV family protein [Phenylobacterium sp.]|uniref:cytochrome C oxidase subunit IV family protein n=1 Tax=Phenylobacterium sp. TaxID=1871053 RepID=UPI002CB9DB86|nr:cytochrome C oxidase subunit IV family protein [Phenylobacterium sp.]HSV03270.1 cytochrome C oxidase subunit IV family protein [Phenylobacterium sp.]
MSGKAWTLIGVWAALMTLLALTVGATFGPFGALKPAINLAIAFAKAGLIFWFFMHLREESWLPRLVAVAAVAWLLILFGLTQADLVTRGVFRA